MAKSKKSPGLGRGIEGRGIEALFDGASAGEPSFHGRGLVHVPLDHVVPDPNQARQIFPEEKLQELADSIREKGVLQPILVEKLKEKSYRILAGERRWRAARMAGLKELPVIVGEYSDAEKQEIALIENIQREDLTPLEEARAYKKLMETAGLGQEELAGRLGKNRSTIANTLRLLKLPKNIQEALTKGELSSGHGRAILSLVNPADMSILFRRITEKNLSVREAEAMAADFNKGQRSAQPSPKAKNSTEQKQIELHEMEERLLDIFGTKVGITGNGKKGKIEISYLSMDDLDRIYAILTTRGAAS